MKKSFFTFFLIFTFFSSYLISSDTRILLQGFYWESANSTDSWWNYLYDKVDDIKDAGIDMVWLPPSQDSFSDEGYMPRQLYVQNSRYGTREELIGLIKRFHSRNIKVIADLVLNHRVGLNDWADFRNPDWGLDACTRDDEYGKCTGNYDTGKPFHAARDIDHTKEYVRRSIEKWMKWLRTDIGYDGWRYDYARGFASKYILEYDEASNSEFSVAEIWDDLDINNPDAHRQALCDWMDSVEGKIKVFDFTTKGMLQYAINTNEYWRLEDKDNKPSGLIGWWPENAVTFIENHDTQNRITSKNDRAWPFPENYILEGYAYILTHPGIPTVFWPHFIKYKDEIKKMIYIRKRYNINSKSKAYIIKADNEIYVALIDNKILVKLGPKKYTPDNSELLLSGKKYSIWLKK